MQATPVEPADQRAHGAAHGHEDVRQAVLSATRRLLSDRRLDELRVVDLIRAAGVSRASFYIYFESKHAAVAALAEDAMEQIQEIWLPWLTGQEPDERLDAVWLKSIAFWREHRAVLMAAAEAWRADAAVGDAWRELMKGYAAAVQKHIEQARAAGQVPSEPDAAMLATVLVWLNESAMYTAFGRGASGPADDHRLARTLSSVWRRVISERDGPDAGELAPPKVAEPQAEPDRAPRRRRRCANNAEVRDAFLAATRRLLEERRLDQLTVVDVIEAAGFSRPTFYQYFSSKHSAVSALAAEVMSEIYERQWRPWIEMANTTTRAAMLEHYLDTLAAWRRHHAILTAAAQGWRTDPETYAAWGETWRSYVAITAAYIERARATGTAPDGPDAETLATSLVWLSETVLYLAFCDSSFEIGEDEDLAATMSAVWLRSIHGTAEPSG